MKITDVHGDLFKVLAHNCLGLSPLESTTGWYIASFNRGVHNESFVNEYKWLHSPKLIYSPWKLWFGDDPFLLGMLTFRGSVSFGVWLNLQDEDYSL